MKKRILIACTMQMDVIKYSSIKFAGNTGSRALMFKAVWQIIPPVSINEYWSKVWNPDVIDMLLIYK